MTQPLKRWSDHVIDTTDSDPTRCASRSATASAAARTPTLNLMSFGFARGIPRNADLVFDMRFLRNPHWEESLRDLTGLDQAVCDHIAGDESYEEALERIEELLLLLLPATGPRENLCLGRIRLYWRPAPLGPRRRTSRSTAACGGFAQSGPSRPRHAARDGIERSAGRSGKHRGGRRFQGE